MEDDFLDNPFTNLPEEAKEEKAPVTKVANNELVSQDDLSTQITSKLSGELPVSDEQRTELRGYMDKMRWGITGVSALTCQDEECPYYSKCPLVRARIPRPVNDDCPVEQALMEQWLEQFINASGVELDALTAYDMLVIQDIAFQQLLEVRAAMEMADNPQIQVASFAGFDAEGNAVSTYTLNNLVTFREKSNKMKMKLMREMMATAAKKEEADRGRRDRSSETADRLKRIEERLGKDGIKTKRVIDAKSD